MHLYYHSKPNFKGSTTQEQELHSNSFKDWKITEANNLKILKNSNKELIPDELFEKTDKYKPRLKSWDSKTSSWFVSSDDENSMFQFSQNQKGYTPLYRKEHGGIIIYDSEAVIPDQPAPAYDGSDMDEINSINNDIVINKVNSWEENANDANELTNKLILNENYKKMSKSSSMILDDQNMSNPFEPLLSKFEIESVYFRSNRGNFKEKRLKYADKSTQIKFYKNKVLKWSSLQTYQRKFFDEQSSKSFELLNTKKAKVYGVNEIPPDLKLLNK